ncbi:hypothetical protein GCM10025857_22110 [Alicyclobacillus contaminans]|uniref:DUF190 domain-containing protein n=1 Tax=Alicyclobacillus contaminans TaxID=392016 RepID=UPI00041D1974|nr:DUF190 domain-containing protein [Alicyclobacillus contaminans]GMA50854.1 hypothetical protein GCM10025857_22110 [Alicyclobacillus contaminans]
MEKSALLVIRLYESDRTKWSARTAYQDIVRYLWQSGAPGITVFRAEEGLDVHGHFQNLYFEYASNNLPITMEVFGLQAEIQQMCAQLSTHLPKSSRLLVIPDVHDLKQANGKGTRICLQDTFSRCT